jgi:hypothetical protein
VTTAPGVIQHPDRVTFGPVWERLAHVADGTGGFLDGTYIVAHPREFKDHTSDTPREPSKKLLERRTLARYDHLAGFIIEQKLSGLFRTEPIRRMKAPDHPYLKWVETDVDGAGHSLSEYLRAQYRSALVFGHCFVVVDRAADDGPTAADAAPLVLRGYGPLDAVDWLVDARGVLTGIQFVEAVPRSSFGQPAAEVLTVTIDATGARKTVHGPSMEPTDLAKADHGFGVLPVTQLFAHRRTTHPVLGQSCLFDPGLFIDLFNLTSELRELLRKQTFSLLNIPLGRGDNGGPATQLESAQALLGQTTGTTGVIFSTERAAYLTAEVENVRVYQETIDALVRQIFRLCAVPYDSDGRDAESAESRRLKRQDYATVLAGYADELERAEYEIAALWFRGHFGVDRWQQEWERAGLEVVYPSEFAPEPFGDILEQASAALALPVGESRTFRAEHAARLIPKFLPGSSEQTVQAILAEVATLPTPEDERAERYEQMTARLKNALPSRTDAA